MKIAVYSGSFNPLHIGHQAIMEYLTTKAGFDWVYLIVSPKNPLKDSISADLQSEAEEAAYQEKIQEWLDAVKDQFKVDLNALKD